MHKRSTSNIPLGICLAFSFLFLVASCESNKTQKANGTYLGGEIVNPKNNVVRIYQNGAFIDSITLDANNSFRYKFKDDFKPGMYTFIHGERQFAHIEEGDSLMFRLNTLEFDESLSFSGYGEEKNNLLIDLFLLREHENDSMTSFYQRAPDHFLETLDSMQKTRRQKVNKFYEKYQVSEPFKKIAEASVKFDNYQRRESYPFSHYGGNKLEFIKQLPSNFYSFRESININDESLYSLNDYSRYLRYYLDHQAFMKYGNKQSYNVSTFDHNKHEMNIIDSIFSSQNIKDRFLARAAIGFMDKSNNKNEVDYIYDKFNQCVTDPALQRRIQGIYDSYSLTAVGAPIPDQMVMDKDRRIVTLSSIITKPTIIYFWSYEIRHHMLNTHLKINELADKYPEYNFIAINTDKDSERWKNTIRQQRYNPDTEFQFTNRKNAFKQLNILSPSKTFIVDKNGFILNSHANLYSTRFEQEMLGFLNQ